MWVWSTSCGNLRMLDAQNEVVELRISSRYSAFVVRNVFAFLPFAVVLSAERCKISRLYSSGSMYIMLEIELS